MGEITIFNPQPPPMPTSNANLKDEGSKRNTTGSQDTHVPRKLPLTQIVITLSFYNSEDECRQRQIFSFRKKVPCAHLKSGKSKGPRLFLEADRRWVEANRMIYLNT